jgi:hypothetical protein
VNSLKAWWDRTTDTLGTLFVGVLTLISLFGGILLFKIACDSIGFDRKCVATIGILDSTYTKVTRKIFFVEYRVTYQFEAGGGTYHGRDELGEKPLQRAVEVFFLPDDPANNRLKRGKSKFEFVLSAFAFTMSVVFFKGYQRALRQGKEPAQVGRI